MMREILDKYPQFAEPAKSKKTYICPVCGYKHEGDINEEPEDRKSVV